MFLLNYFILIKLKFYWLVHDIKYYDITSIDVILLVFLALLIFNLFILGRGIYYFLKARKKPSWGWFLSVLGYLFVCWVADLWFEVLASV